MGIAEFAHSFDLKIVRTSFTPIGLFEPESSGVHALANRKKERLCMGKKNEQKPMRRQRFRIKQSHIMLISAFIVVVAGILIFKELPSSEEMDLSLIGKGDNVVVQVHDPH